MPVIENGIKTFLFGEGTHSRTSGAYSPDDGKVYRNNKPRVVQNRIPYNTWVPKVYFSFPENETRMEYDTTGNNLVARQAQFETEFPEFTRHNLGLSFQGRSIFGYRLGPTSRKHFVFVNAVHGNEIDGMNGAFKAMEIIAREPEFRAFRDEYTIFFVPALNPDGWKLGTRNLAQVGPNGLTINLNRNFDWFWDEYVESSFESKGSSPESTSEAQSLLSYLRTGNGGNPVPKGILIDFHANEGTGARYTSRDRIWRDITNPTYGSATLPTDRLTSHIEWHIWRTVLSLSTLRARTAEGPDLWVRYLRSRFRPHLHAYHSSIGWVSIAVEELKVDSANGFETFKTASDYRVDYVLSVAQMATEANWRFDDAVLLEEAGNNIQNNSDFEQWQPDDERPGFFSTSRAEITRRHHVPGVSPADPLDRLYDNGGSGVELHSLTALELDATEEFTRSASSAIGEIGFLLPSARNWFRFILLEDHNADEIFGSPMTRTTLFGSGVANAGVQRVDVIGGGATPPNTGAVSTVTRIVTTDGSESETNVGNLNTARMFHATADNFLDDPSTVANRRAYVFGGFNAAGSRITSIEVWNPNTDMASVATATLPTALAEAVAVYSPTNDKIYIFGGSTDATPVVDTIYEYDPVGDSIALLSSNVPVPLKNLAAAFVPFNDRIYLFGGENSAGNMVSTVYVFNPASPNTDPVQEDTRQNLGDDEDLEVPGGEAGPWIVRIGRWSAVTLIEDVNDEEGSVYLPGGRLDDTSGSLLDTVYRYDPIDMIIGLPRESDYGYFRYGTALVDRRYNPRIEVTVDSATDRFRFSDDIDFSSGAVNIDVVEFTDDADNTGIRLDGSDLSGQPDIRPSDTFTGPVGSGTVDRVSYDNFPSLDETNIWEDPNNIWAATAGTAEASGGDGPLKFRMLPDFRNQKVSLTVQANGGALANDFSVVGRGTYSGSTLTDGYRVRYDASEQDWILERVVASSATTLATLDVSADANRQITTSARTLTCRFENGIGMPVHLVVTFNGLSIFNFFDLTESRINSTGQVALEGGGNGVTTRVDAFALETAGWREGRYASSVGVRSETQNVSGYTRQSSQTKDDSSDAHPLGSSIGDFDDFTLRYIRNYYTLPPSKYFQYYRTRVDLAEGPVNHKEDGFRWYGRIYKHDQRQLVSGPCTVQGTLIPHSFIHPESPASKDIFTFSNAVNLNSFRLEFRWLPTFIHADVRNDIELLRLEIDANNYISLTLIAGDADERTYNLGDVHGTHDPIVRLTKVRGGSTVATVDVACYYGYDNREPSAEYQDDTIKFTIEHLTGPGGNFSLEIEKYQNRGRRSSSVDLVAFSGSDLADMIFRGVGYFGTPRLVIQDQSERTNFRKLPVLRRGLLHRVNRVNRDCVTVGDRDPTNGQRVQDNPYRLPETFDRANDANLGSDWDIIRSDGNGFDIVNNKAQASGVSEAFERWDAQPGNRNYILEAKVTINSNNDLIGVLGRYLNEFFNNGAGVICGYGCELRQTGSTAAEVRVIIWWLDNRTILGTDTLSSYSSGTEYGLRFTLQGTTLRGEVYTLSGLGEFETQLADTGVINTTLFPRPGRIGIYCEAPGGVVTIDDVLARELFTTDL